MAAGVLQDELKTLEDSLLLQVQGLAHEARPPNEKSPFAPSSRNQIHTKAPPPPPLPNKRPTNPSEQSLNNPTTPQNLLEL